MPTQNGENVPVSKVYTNFYCRLTHINSQYLRWLTDDGTQTLDHLNRWQQEVGFWSSGRNVLEEMESMGVDVEGIRDQLNSLHRAVELVEQHANSVNGNSGSPLAPLAQELNITVTKFCYENGINDYIKQKKQQAAATTTRFAHPSRSHTPPAASRASPGASSSPLDINASHPTTATFQRRSLPTKQDLPLDALPVDTSNLDRSSSRNDSLFATQTAHPKNESPQIKSFHAFVEQPTYPAVSTSPTSSYHYSPTSTAQDTPPPFPRALSPVTPLDNSFSAPRSVADSHHEADATWTNTLPLPGTSPAVTPQLRTLEPPIVSPHHRPLHHGITEPGDYHRHDNYRQSSTVPEPVWVSNQQPSSPPSE
ncbi:hypothetical protein EJ08DRAFT_382280 [Tothia fuscella]|uniref:Uncharacterized protein n=1 Tax=Tothia fuscella TaxID=1048955 RepID=A0A9P4NKY4_9PEZI|nr:hypothetical protein EJ08DRAFT_382280 [Tothia fuscella]